MFSGPDSLVCRACIGKCDSQAGTTTLCTTNCQQYHRSHEVAANTSADDDCISNSKTSASNTSASAAQIPVPAVRQSRLQVCMPAAATWCSANFDMCGEPEGGLDMCCRLQAMCNIQSDWHGMIVRIKAAAWSTLCGAQSFCSLLDAFTLSPNELVDNPANVKCNHCYISFHLYMACACAGCWSCGLSTLDLTVGNRLCLTQAFTSVHVGIYHDCVHAGQMQYHACSCVVQPNTTLHECKLYYSVLFIQAVQISAFVSVNMTSDL